MLSNRAAQELLAHLDLEAPNRALAEHWLALWDGDALPPRSRLDPRKIKSFLPHIMIFDAVPGRSVTVRLAGTRYSKALGTELTGVDWIAAAPAHYRAERLRIISQIARGAIGVGHRRVAMTDGNDYTCEEIVLPFAAEPGGTHPVLVHVDWRPQYLTQVQSPQQAMGVHWIFRCSASAATSYRNRHSAQSLRTYP